LNKFKKQKPAKAEESENLNESENSALFSSRVKQAGFYT
jgi:hypothetical protein